MGDFDEQVFDFDDDELTPTQLNALRALIKTLKRTFPVKYLGGHTEFAKLRGDDRDCPGNVLMKEMPKLRAEFSLAPPPK